MQVERCAVWRGDRELVGIQNPAAEPEMYIYLSRLSAWWLAKLLCFLNLGFRISETSIKRPCACEVLGAVVALRSR